MAEFKMATISELKQLRLSWSLQDLFQSCLGWGINVIVMYLQNPQEGLFSVEDQLFASQ